MTMMVVSVGRGHGLNSQLLQSMTRTPQDINQVIPTAVALDAYAPRNEEFRATNGMVAHGAVIEAHQSKVPNQVGELIVEDQVSELVTENGDLVNQIVLLQVLERVDEDLWW